MMFPFKNCNQNDGEQVTTSSTQERTTQAAVDYFHQILEDQDVSQATHRSLICGQHAVGMTMAGRPLTQILRPRLIYGTEHAGICSTSSLLNGTLQRLITYALHDDELGNHVRQVLALTPMEKALIAMSPPIDNQHSHGRFDGFFTSNRLAFVEYNAHPPAGPLTQEALADIFARTPAMQEFTGKYHVQASPARQQIVESLIHAWITGGIPGDGPRVGIVECGESKYSWEFEMLLAELVRHGVPAVITSTDELCYEPAHGGLYTRDNHGRRQPITIVYRRAVLSDMLSRYGPTLTDHPLIRAWSAGACVMMNSFTSYLGFKKSTFALLTDPYTSVALSPREAMATQEHLPWTRLLRSGSTTYHGEGIDLLTFAYTNRKNLVLKPNVGYSGWGILCGWQTTDEGWQRALARAIRDSYVIQERVTVPHALYPALVNGTMEIRPYRESTDPFLFASTCYGHICRLSQNEIINVGSGGTLIPVFQIAPRA